MDWTTDLVALVVGMYGNRNVSEHCFRSRRTNRDFLICRLVLSHSGLTSARRRNVPVPSISQEKYVIVPNSNFSFGSYPGTLSIVLPLISKSSTCAPQNIGMCLGEGIRQVAHLLVRERCVEAHAPIDETF